MLCKCTAFRPVSWQVSGVSTASHARRIGAADSESRARLVQAAEELMLDEGYAAVTSRASVPRPG